jgi:hypothetical protein
MYLITLQAVKTSGRERSRIPFSFFIINQRPHQPPGNNTTQKHRNVHDIGTNHPNSNINRREVKVKPTKVETSVKTHREKCQRTYFSFTKLEYGFYLLA